MRIVTIGCALFIQIYLLSTYKIVHFYYQRLIVGIVPAHNLSMAKSIIFSKPKTILFDFLKISEDLQPFRRLLSLSLARFDSLCCDERANEGTSGHKKRQLMQPQAFKASYC